MSNVSPNNSASTENPVELGYVEEMGDRVLLRNFYFPSKVGGKPAWLTLNPLPDKSILRCKVCSQQMCFLMQIYAPDYDQPCAFHRSLFLFVCRIGACSKPNSAENFVVLRCQLPRVNQFYSDNAVTEIEHVEKANLVLDQYSSKLCTVCGCPAENRCSKCKESVYCDRSHQLLHWKAGHKNKCGLINQPASDENIEFLFNEFELITETEVLANESRPIEKSDAEKMREYEQYAKTLTFDAGTKVGVSKAQSADELESMSSSRADKLFKKFSQRLQQNPEQVLRYQKKGSPMWATEVQPVHVTCCQLCGADRVFEFQVMPQLLSHLDVDEVGASLDWATVVVYTCSKSCDVPDYGYATEFVWKQDFSE